MYVSEFRINHFSFSSSIFINANVRIIRGIVILYQYRLFHGVMTLHVIF